MLRYLLLAILAPIAALLLWMTMGAQEPRADFVVASDELRTLDPHRVSFMDEIQVANCIFEGLTRLNPLTLLPEAAVAESWEISNDGREYRFKLRNDVQWANGDPLVSSDFRIGWVRALTPSTESQYASLLFVIDGAQAYYKSFEHGKPTSSETVGVDATDPRVLVVKLRAPCAYFLDLTAFPTFAPVHQASLAVWAFGDGVALATRHRWARPGNLVENGPFRLTAWDFKRRLILERNRAYWDAAAIWPKKIEIAITPSPTAAMLGYETGRIDLVRGLEPELARTLRKLNAQGERPDFHIGDRFSTFFLRLNCSPGAATADVNFRRALSLAIDRVALCESVLGLGETPAYTFVPRSAIPLMRRSDAGGKPAYYDPPAGLGAEMLGGAIRPLPPEKRAALARQFLAASEFDRTKQTLRLSFASDPPQQRRVMEAIQAMWERELGLRVDLEVMERKVLSQRIRQLDYEVVRSDWYGDYMDPATFLEMFVGGSSQNRTGWVFPAYDERIRAAAAATDASERFAQFSEAERILCEDQVPIVPLYVKTGNFLLNPAFGGITDNVRDTLMIHRVRPKTGK